MTGDRLAIVVFSADFERVHYALAMAAAAAALGRPASLLITGGALRAIAAELEGQAGWRSLHAADGRTAGQVDADQCARGVAGFEELLSACAELNVRLIACEMGMRLAGLDQRDLRADLTIEAAGLATFLADAPAGITFV
ncbi:MAG: DsrE/DsrF/DrsH-like family protein [Rhodospirillales bacterium]|jgi:peroxiredoxin family protein|nr:DsrE/DsrF/DrsH-like family protein [Rhodospirillales bacterium]